MTRAERFEGVVLVAILLTVGTLAGAASFTHVHDWTMHNSPAGTPDWFGWANAAISELLPIAALLTIRARRRADRPIGYPMFLLVCGVALSLSAQLAVAKPGISGWLLSAVPALAFMGLSKLVLSGKPAMPAAPIKAPVMEPAHWVPTEPTPATEAHPSPGGDEPQPRPANDRSGLVPVPALAFTRPNAEVAR
ncbi:MULTISPECIES: DUF2637 domain-containing protein [Catenuloplanes]|uniref:DUF2637 domain-containing protein n=1 Tax=Catenuloplanes niger TaxID=587534 RepID=A0AAE3ZP07_9ACTN|nr:DUF2637 domain-containing protein [Catenuloplanes niger]MDR7323463.1 hypothetical protein [Catenuloplanes niger]